MHGEHVVGCARRSRCAGWLAGLAVCAIAGLSSLPVQAAIIGDCNGDGAVTIDELVTGVAIALGVTPLAQCPPFDANGDGVVSIDELVRAVAAALAAAPSATPTAIAATFTAMPPTVTRVPPTSTPVPPTVTPVPPTFTPVPPTSTPSPTPFAQVLNFGAVGGEPCSTTQLSFTIPDGLDFTVSALRVDFCLDPTVFNVSGITCSSFSSSVAIDHVTLSPNCTLDNASDPSGQVRVDAHGSGGDSGMVFQPSDEIDCRVPVLPAATGGDYAVRYRIAATTSRGSLVNSGNGTITVFAQPTGRSQSECCTADAQCASGFCRAGDSTQYNACCESDCASGICNSAGFAGSCCAASGLPDACVAP